MTSNTELDELIARHENALKRIADLKAGGKKLSWGQWVVQHWRNNSHNIANVLFAGAIVVLSGRLLVDRQAHEVSLSLLSSRAGLGVMAFSMIPDRVCLPIDSHGVTCRPKRNHPHFHLCFICVFLPSIFQGFFMFPRRCPCLWCSFAIRSSGSLQVQNAWALTAKNMQLLSEK